MDPEDSSLAELIDRYHLKQVVKDPTHKLGGTLDHMYIDFRCPKNEASVFPLPYTDHHVVWITLSIPS